MIGLIRYYRKFFPVYSDIRSLNELTKKHIPFKWTEQCQKSLDYIKQVITTNPILVYPDPDKQYYLFMDSSKHSWSGILVQYTEQAREDGTKFKVPHPITYQNRTFQGSQKNWSTLTKEAYAIYMSFHKTVFYLREAHIMVRCYCDHLWKFVYSGNKNDKVNNWSQEIHSITPHNEFKHIKGKENVLTDSLSRLWCLGLCDDNDPEESG